MTGSPAWDTFERRMREVSDLEAVGALLVWDEQTYCSKSGHDTRAYQQAALASLVHERIVDSAYGEIVDELADSPNGLSQEHRAMVRVVKHDRDRAVRLSPELVRALAAQGSRTNAAWEAARAQRDFNVYRPELEKMIALKIEQADALREGDERYDAMLDAFEPGMTTAELEPLLDGLRADLVPFARRVLDAPPPDDAVMRQHYPNDAQWDFSLEVLRELCFDFDAGRQDISSHPFTGGPGPTDVRLTTRVNERFLPMCVLSTIHEAGHGLYEQGQNPAYLRTSIGRAPSLGLHESQSRFYEHVLGGSEAFWEHMLPIAKRHFPEQLGGVALRDFVRALNRVEASAIRVNADEVTYNLHILVRFELELALIREELAVADLPEAWREKMTSVVGYTPKDDVEGVMQDIHWSWGELGYFPTYTLGNLYSAAIAEAMRRDLDLDEAARTGDFGSILAWLREKVHRRGYVLHGEDLMREVTGQPLGHEAFMRYLTRRYTELYGL
jgi:carboxypeptidase Taq